MVVSVGRSRIIVRFVRLVCLFPFRNLHSGFGHFGCSFGSILFVHLVALFFFFGCLSYLSTFRAFF